MATEKLKTDKRTNENKNNNKTISQARGYPQNKKEEEKKLPTLPTEIWDMIGEYFSWKSYKGYKTYYNLCVSQKSIFNALAGNLPVRQARLIVSRLGGIEEAFQNGTGDSKREKIKSLLQGLNRQIIWKEGMSRLFRNNLFSKSSYKKNNILLSWWAFVNSDRDTRKTLSAVLDYAIFKNYAQNSIFVTNFLIYFITYGYDKEQKILVERTPQEKLAAARDFCDHLASLMRQRREMSPTDPLSFSDEAVANTIALALHRTGISYADFATAFQSQFSKYENDDDKIFLGYDYKEYPNKYIRYISGCCPNNSHLRYISILNIPIFLLFGSIVGLEAGKNPTRDSNFNFSLIMTLLSFALICLPLLAMTPQYYVQRTERGFFQSPIPKTKPFLRLVNKHIESIKMTEEEEEEKKKNPVASKKREQAKNDILLFFPSSGNSSFTGPRDDEKTPLKKNTAPRLNYSTESEK